MRDPGAVMARLHFAKFVAPHFLQRLLVGRRIVSDRNLRRHPTHGMDAAPVAGLDQQFDVGAQEMPLPS